MVKKKNYSELGYKDLDADIFADLVNSEQKYRRILELGNDLVIETNKTGKIILVTPSINKMLGYTEDAVLGQGVFDFVYIKDRKKAVDVFKQLFLGGQGVRVAIRVLKNDGSLLWVEANAQVARDDKEKIIGAFAVIRDISQQHKVLRLLKRTNAELNMFKMAAQKAFNHIIITDPDGKIVFANNGVKRITGYDVVEVLGNTPALWGKQMGKDFYMQMWHTIKVERKPFHGEIINKRKNGDLYTAIATVSPIIDPQGGLVGFIGVEEDISHLKPPSKT